MSKMDSSWKFSWDLWNEALVPDLTTLEESTELNSHLTEVSPEVLSPVATPVPEDLTPGAHVQADHGESDFEGLFEISALHTAGAHNYVK